MGTLSYDEASLSPGSLIPQRNPGLIRRVANAIFRADPTFGPQPADQQTTQSGVVAQALQSVYDQYFRSQNDRLAIYKDVDEMDQAAEEVSTALDAIANNVCTAEDGQMESFDLVSEDARVLKIINDACDQSGLHHKIRPWTRNVLKYGDGFTEIVVNANAEIVDVKQLPPSTMWRNVDVRGNLLVGEPQYDPRTGMCLNKQRECAFEQRAEDTNSVVAAFWPWQIVHTRLNWDGYKAYGRSHLRVTRIIWKKLKAMEEALIIARLTRAWPSNRWFIDTTGMSLPQKEDALGKFQRSVSNRRQLDGMRENPAWVGSDYFIADNWVTRGSDMKESRTRVETYDPRMTGLSNINDYEYLHRKMLATLRIPAAYLNFEKDTRARAILNNEDVQYIRFLRDIQGLMTHSIKQVLDIALILNGIDPETAEYEIVWPTLSANDEGAAAESEQLRSQADQFYSGIGVIDKDWMQRNRFGFGDEEIEAMEKRQEEEKAEQAQEEADKAEADIQRQLRLMPKAGTPPPNEANPVPAAVDGFQKTGGNKVIRQDAVLTAEAISLRAMDLLRTDILRVRSSQEIALNGHK